MQATDVCHIRLFIRSLRGARYNVAEPCDGDAGFMGKQNRCSVVESLSRIESGGWICCAATDALKLKERVEDISLVVECKSLGCEKQMAGITHQQIGKDAVVLTSSS